MPHFLRTLLTLFLCLCYSYSAQAEIISLANKGLGLIHCRYTLDHHSPNDHQIKSMNITFDIGRLDESDLVKIIDNRRHESIGIYSIQRQWQDQHYQVTFQVIDEADNTTFFKLIYPENGGASHFYTKIEEARWINMCHDTVITPSNRTSYAGRCHYIPD